MGESLTENQTNTQMKRIGILTHPLIANYGGILQNYALQTVFRKLGYEAITLRTGKFVFVRWLYKYCKMLAVGVVYGKTKLPEFPLKIERKRVGLEDFIKRNIKTTKKIYWYYPNLVKEYSIDALCVGSDKIWASYFYDKIVDLFFDFAHSYDIPKFSYAPSFGSTNWHFSEKATRKVRLLTKDFTGLSVREQSGQELCSKFLNRDAFWAIDPTFLLNADDYNELCKSQIREEKTFLFAYILDLSDEILHFIRMIAQRMELEVRLVRAESEIQPSDTVEQWVANFRDAQFVITDSFHGTAFSIIYRKNFYCILNEDRGIDRFNSLISIVQRNDRFVSVLPDYETCDIAPFSWTEIENRLEQWKLSSTDYIINSLKNI